jgi:glycosyltransferase involved in cell wall biosynthesis
MVGSWEYSGSGKGMTYYGEGLTASGFDVDFMSFGEPHACISHPERFAGMNRLVVQPPLLPFDSMPTAANALSLINEILQWVSLHRQERLVVWGHYLYPYACAALLAAGLARNRGATIDCIVTPAGSDVWDPDLHMRPLLDGALAFGHPHGIVFYSKRFLDEAMGAYLSMSRFHSCILRPVLPDDHYHPQTSDDTRNTLRDEYGIRQNDPVICIVSNMRPRKNVETLFRILDALGVLRLSPTVLLVGPVHHKAVGTCKVVNTGVVADVRPYIWASDICINISLRDSFNFALLESMLCGIPTVSTPPAAISEDMREHDPRTVVEIDDTDSVSRSGAFVEKVLTDRAFGREFGILQQQEMQRRFGLSRNCGRFREDILNILKPRGANEGP